MNVREKRRGFTLIELLVVIAIIGVLIGLILPAINGAREAGRKAQCLSNMKNVTLGIVNYVNGKNRYPNLGTWGENTADAGYPRAQQINSNTLDVLPNEASGNGSGNDLGPLYSWVVEILPAIDAQNLYNDFNRNRVYFDDPDIFGGVSGRLYDTSKPSNLTIGDTDLKVLICPNDDTTVANRGNLSYAANMGFARWQFDGVNGYGWAGGPTSGQPQVMSWGPGGVGNIGGYGSFKKSGLTFLGSKSGRLPWDIYNSTASVRDGSSQTVLLAENSNGGASEGGQPYGWTGNFGGSGAIPVPTNWATPHPNFVGFMGSDNICATGNGNCAAATDLIPIQGKADGPGWVRASVKGSNEEINYGAKNITDTGGHPFANSLHPGGIVVSMCDGSAKFIADDINGMVWAKLITPDGQTLPVTANGGYRQLPLKESEIPGS